MLTTQRHGTIRKRINPSDLRRWARRGDSAATIARRVGCCEKTARRRLIELGLLEERTVSLRKPLPSPPPPPAADEPDEPQDHAALCRAGFLRSVAYDAERETLAAGDSNEHAADAILDRRLAALKQLFAGDAIHVGEGDAADEHEKRLRRQGAIR